MCKPCQKKGHHPADDDDQADKRRTDVACPYTCGTEDMDGKFVKHQELEDLVHDAKGSVGVAIHVK